MPLHVAQKSNEIAENKIGGRGEWERQNNRAEVGEKRRFRLQRYYRSSPKRRDDETTGAGVNRLQRLHGNAWRLFCCGIRFFSSICPFVVE